MLILTVGFGIETSGGMRNSGPKMGIDPDPREIPIREKIPPKIPAPRLIP